MKKFFTIFFSFLLPCFVAAQVVATNPPFITPSTNGAVEIIFDAAQGNQGLKDYTGDIYAHTGVITSQSADGGDWKHVKAAWETNIPACKLAPLGNNKWKLLITPSITEFYGITEGEIIEKLAFVFRSGVKVNGNYKEGKDVGNANIFVNIVEEGLNVRFVEPMGNQLVNLNSTVNFSATASENAALELRINGVSKQTSTGTVLNCSQNFTVADDYQCIIFATKNEQTVSDTVNLCVLSSAPAEALPAGLTEGINYDNADATKTTLVMYAKDKNDALPDNVLVIGDFNDWIYSNAYQMKKDVNTGNWWLTLENLEPQREYAYQYAVKIGSNIVKISDAYAEKVLDPWNDKYISEDIYPNLKPYPDGKTDGLAAVFQTQKTEFAWSTSTLNFQKPNKKNLVIYELWIYDFTSYRSVNELINRLDYLENLGVNAIELMPICEFDGNINWGYGPNHYFAPDKAYGSPDAYKTLIDECHKRGIAIILDMVFNHATGLNPWAKLYWDSSINDVSAKNPWFNVDAVPADVDFFQDFNHDFYGTKEYFKRVLQYWLAEYKVDGFRMDVSKGFCGDANCNNRVDRINEYYDAVKSVDTDAYFILEHWYGAEEQGFVNNGMLCWGGGASMNNAYSQTAMGWLKDGDDISFSNNTSKGWVYFAESHDEERNFYKTKTWGNGNLQANEAARLSRVPLNVAFNVLLQGPKMMWQYEEMGYDFSINHCPDGTNDENCRTQPKPSPDALGWYSNSLRMSAYNKIAKLIALRTKLLPNVFINGTTSDVTLGSGQSIRKILWTYDNKKILVVGNFNVDGGTQYTGSKTYQMPAETWYNYLNNNTIQNGGMNITLQPGELLVFTNDNSIVAPDDVSFDYTSEIPYVFDENYAFIYPTFTDSYLFLETNGKVENITVFTLRGQQVLSTKNTKEINVSALESGLYLIVVTFDKRQLAFKFIRK